MNTAPFFAPASCAAVPPCGCWFNTSNPPNSVPITFLANTDTGRSPLPLSTARFASAATSRLAYLAVHNHGSDRRVNFSRIDIESHERGYPALMDIGRGVPVGALVYGRRSVAADIWLPDGTRRSLGTYRVIGREVTRLYSQTAPRAWVAPRTRAPSAHVRRVWTANSRSEQGGLSSASAASVHW